MTESKFYWTLDPASDLQITERTEKHVEQHHKYPISKIQTSRKFHRTNHQRSSTINCKQKQGMEGEPVDQKKNLNLSAF